ncbi:alginate lyase family protein [Mariniflexile gromovii]|uniref:Alginate lyase family protein n=1 Tax=Mariniflexile gromovii TaxID=362523 RepID=A0ABS4BUY1_9FLAO|nr:alginate lyase family protein [Mariniflexile gromovii]MBP0903880.1 alginate lyase family protein [Mariniflexile gromovii]
MKNNTSKFNKIPKHLFLLLFFIATGTTLSAKPNVIESILSSALQTRAAKANDTISYTFQLKNASQNSETYYLSVKNPRELACINSLSISKVTLEPHAIYNGTLSVIVSDRMPLGGHESSIILIKDEKEELLETLEFITVRSKPHPFLLVTNPVIEEAKQKIAKYDWAKQNLDNMLKELDGFKFPEREIVTKPRPTKVWSSLNYSASDGEKAFQLALAYKLTGNVNYKNKVVALIKAVCDKEKGYLSIGAATNGVQVHEGNFFLFLSAACDIIFNESEFSKQDKENIEATFRYYLALNKKHMDGLGIMNHQASANAGAIFVALFLQDIPELEYLTEADGGMADQIGKGVMADGWWFEGTGNYCYLVVQRYTLVAQAFKNYGLDLYHRRFPAKFKSKDFDNVKEGFTGMKFDNWGPTGKNTRGLEDMVTPYIPFMDENAYLVSTNDSDLKEPNEFYELAYREYKNPDLAWVISKTKRDSWVSLMYGVPELPKTEDPRAESVYAPNIGLVALRSQAEVNTPENQIQAFLKYGTHGGWHGQFDRASLVALDRFGHKYFGTEMVWFGYGNPGYKECVQTSATHNMVVVDELQQEAVPSELLLFYKGELMQASVVETNARWRKIPTWNADKFPPWDDTDYDPNFKPIQQRRLSVVTDDYVVLADYMKSDQKHNYDWLMHPVGFKNIVGAKKKGSTLDKLSTVNTSPYKYFENAQWYTSKSETKVEFDENGMKLDVHTLWPKKADVLLCNYPNGGKQRDIRNNPDRRTYGVRVNEKEVQFLNVIEPYKGESTILKIESNNSNELSVYLKDGRKQTIEISNMQNENVQIAIKEFVNGKLIKSEQSEMMQTEN